MSMLKLDTEIAKIPGLNSRFLVKLKNLGIKTVHDLLYHHPTRYEDFSEIYKIENLIPGQQATISGVIEKISSRHAWKKRMSITEAVISDETGAIGAVWFNQPYVKNILKIGQNFNFSGKISERSGDIYFSNPTYEIASKENEALRHTGRLLAIYPETRGFTSKGIRFVISEILKNTEKQKEFLPKFVLEKFNLPEINQAVKNIHLPESLDDALIARKRFDFEQLLLLQVSNLIRRKEINKLKAESLKSNISEIKEILTQLPFELTHAQKRSLWEIIQDLEKTKPMNRLLQGDVGSGKTIIAALAALISQKNGHQTALMAPTSILAKQHYETTKNTLGKFNVRIGLLTSEDALIFHSDGLESTAKKMDFIREVKNRNIDIIIGTHALITESKNTLEIPDLALVIVDEQHRFGVKQRAKLLSEKSKKGVPHFLSMSATPIPRTLTLTIFGDLDLSIIDELPAGRKNIVTKSVAPNKRNEAYTFIRNQIKIGRQAFVICPRIEPSEIEQETDWLKLDLKSVKEEYGKLSKKVFPDLKVAMLHGKMKAKEKDTIMSDFANRKIDVLVSTSVIEVGVNVPNATIMLIESAERFGLAQLYQFRGRVGRGEHQSYCLMFTESNSASAQRRLKAITEARNGFELAEADLALRGPGEFIGNKQTGVPDLAMRALSDAMLIKESREAAEEILAQDKELVKNSLLKERIKEFEKSIHEE